LRYLRYLRSKKTFNSDYLFAQQTNYL